MPYDPELIAKLRAAKTTPKTGYNPELIAQLRAKKQTEPTMWERFKAGFMGKEIPQPAGFEKGDIAELAGSTGLETIGGTVGGIIGGAGGAVAAPLTFGASIPTGAIAGTGYGAAAGKALHEGIRRSIGAFKPGSTDMGTDLGVVGRVAGEGLLQATGAKYLPLAPKMLGKAGNWLTKKAASLVFGPSTEAIEARIADPVRIQTAKTFSEIARTVPEALGKIEKNIAEYDKSAWETLSDVSGYSADKIIDIVAQGKQSIGKLVGEADKKAAKTLSDIQKDIESLYTKSSGGKEIFTRDANGNLVKQFIPESVDISEIPETEIKSMIQKIDANIDWDKPGLSTVNTKLENVRHGLDTLLKKGNKAYSKAMEPVASAMETLTKSKSSLAAKKAVGGGYDITDTTLSKLKNLKNKEVTPEVLDRLKAETGIDFNALVRDREIADEFLKSYIHGSRRTIPGGLIGGAVGGPLGAAIGTGAGYATDVLGSRALGKAIDITAPALRKQLIPQLIETHGRYITPTLISGSEELKRKYNSKK